MTVSKYCLFIYIFCLTPSFSSANASAPPTPSAFDYSLSGVARTPPFGAALRGEVGRSFPLNQDSASDYFRGRIRPRLALQSSGIVNVLAPAIDIFPVAFLGMTFGGDYVHRTDPILGLDCYTYECGGWLNSEYVRLTLAYQYQSFFAVLNHERRFYSARTDVSKNLIDSANLFSIAPSSDRGSLTSLLIGNKLVTGDVLGLQAQLQTAETSKGFQNQQFLFYVLVKPDYSYVFSAGRFESDIYRPTPQVAFAISWATANKPAL